MPQHRRQNICSSQIPLNKSPDPTWAPSVRSVKESPRCGLENSNILRWIICIWWDHMLKFNVLSGFIPILLRASFCLHISLILGRNKITVSTGFVAILVYHSHFLFYWLFQIVMFKSSYSHYGPGQFSNDWYFIPKISFCINCTKRNKWSFQMMIKAF